MARFVAENYGDSELAQKFGVTRYPAIFVDDVLVATPMDFGFYGKGEGAGEGRYTPLKSAAAQERLSADLTRMIELVASGRKDQARAHAAPAASDEIPTLPSIAIHDLDGKPLARESLAGRVVLVEFWATWCPPCRGALVKLGDLAKQHGDRVAVITIAVESDEAAVRKLASELALPFTWTLATPEIARAFGDVSAVPTLYVFGGDGKTVGVYFGAPPTLHADVGAKVEELLRNR